MKAIKTLQIHISRQFGKPRGVIGVLVGWMLSIGNSNLNRYAAGRLKVQRHDHVLEIGCGPGQLMRRLVSMVPNGSVTGIDHSRLMTRIAHLRNIRAIREHRAFTYESRVEMLPALPHNQFDKVVSVNSVYLWRRRIQCFIELKRRLSEGGTILLTLEPRWTKNKLSQRMEGYRLVGELRLAGFSGVQLDFRTERNRSFIVVSAINADSPNGVVPDNSQASRKLFRNESN